jgi:serine/threonine protein kinase/WD40 repeat protein
MEDMDSQAPVHPDTDQLHRFGRGLLAPAEAAVLEEHLGGCDSCCRLLEAVPSDSFVGRLREAKDVSSSDTLSYTTGATFLPDEIPGDLADHPRYRVFRLLGRGGMGAVYLAEHRRMDRLVALKVIHSEFLDHTGALLRFQQEVKAAALLDHANIVAAHDADQAGNLHFLVMEYVEGRNLADYLANEGPLPIGQACDIIRQAALGLQHAHERGMVHRDIKPHNLMLTPSGQVKVLDFGMARFATESTEAARSQETGVRRQESGDGSHLASRSPDACLLTPGAQRLTGIGAVLGTADYIAPEQARDAHLADGRSDIYSLGCTFYHLLTGQPPFPYGTAREKLLLHTTASPLEPRDLRCEIPEGLARIVAKMLARRPEDRHQAPAEVAIALQAFTTNTGRVRKSPRPRLVIAAALLFAGILCAASAVYYIKAHQDDVEKTAQRMGVATAEPVLSEQVGEVRRWQGHSSAVFRIVVAPDGRSAWSVANDFRRWDVATGTTVQRVVTPLRLEELLPTLDGKQFLTMDQPGGVNRLYDVATMQQVRAFEPGTLKSWQAAWFPDGRRFLTDGYDGIARIWDVNTGVPIHEFLSPGEIACVAVNQDGNQFLTGAAVDRKIRVWDLNTEAVRFEIAEQVCHPNSAHFVLGGKGILTCGRDGSIRLFDAQTGKLMRVFSTPKKSILWARIALFKDGRHFVSADSHEILRLWRIDSEHALYTVRTDLGGAASLAVTPDGRNLLIGTFDGEIVQWRLPEQPASETAGTNTDIGFPSLSNAAKKPTTESSAQPTSWPAPKKVGDKIWLDGYTDAVWGVAFSPDGRYTLTTGRRNYLHDRSDYHVARRLGGSPWFAAFAPDSRHALTSDMFMRGLILWNTESGDVVRRYGNAAARGRVLNAGFSPDGKYVAASEWDVLRVYDRETGKVVMTASTHPGCRPTFAFITARRLLAIDRDGRSIRTFAVETSKEIAPPLRSSDPLWGVVVSPNGKTVLATRSDGDELVIWEVGTQHPVRRLVPKQRATRYTEPQLAFLPDGRRALVTRADGTMTLWDVLTGRELQRWSDLGEIVGLAVSPDGRWALCGLFSKRAFLFRLPEPVPPETVSKR